MSHRLQINLTDEDAALIAAAARRARLSQSSWARTVLAQAITAIVDTAPPLNADQAATLTAAGLTAAQTRREQGGWPDEAA